MFSWPYLDSPVHATLFGEKNLADGKNSHILTWKYFTFSFDIRHYQSTIFIYVVFSEKWWSYERRENKNRQKATRAPRELVKTREVVSLHQDLDEWRCSLSEVRCVRAQDVRLFLLLFQHTKDLDVWFINNPTSNKGEDVLRVKCTWSYRRKVSFVSFLGANDCCSCRLLKLDLFWKVEIKTAGQELKNAIRFQLFRLHLTPLISFLLF